MLFLTALEAKTKIKRLMETSPTADLAVAFWGNGALEELGINNRQAQLNVVCNLSLGGTNPDVLKSLQNSPYNPCITQNDRLHAKVYLFESAAVIGSSNASVNGLALEGAELTHWIEANILVTEKKILQRIRQWMQELQKRPITENDLTRARAKWKSRRRAAPIAPSGGNTVLDVLLTEHELFRDRNAYLIIYFDDLNEEVENFQNILQEQYPEGVSVLEGWNDLPSECHLLCFEATRRSFRWDGIWCKTPEFPNHKLDNGTIVQIVWKKHDVFGLEVKTNQMNAWRDLCKQIVTEKGRNDGIFIPLYELGECLKRQQSKKTKNKAR